MQGKEVDMAKLFGQNEMAVAVGNQRVNARGDELGPGGKIIRKREDIIRDATSRVPAQSNVRKNAVPEVEVPVEPKVTNTIKKNRVGSKTDD